MPICHNVDFENRRQMILMHFAEALAMHLRVTEHSQLLVQA